jgi:hypothetical protein
MRWRKMCGASIAVPDMSGDNKAKRAWQGGWLWAGMLAVGKPAVGPLLIGVEGLAFCFFVRVAIRQPAAEGCFRRRLNVESFPNPLV